ncbi:7TM diverse intracellular signaling domain-containing protein [Fulvivirga lutea]|uniref:histidine kinase n=1 Tax=Fulvivirga lutea TaxID=2810512 RepID=A0A974WL71_9BACT|nr:7TM diverse intracellular signaling domain-containing protein [Fulvivirga lutea]QSE98240.1 GHKL domain-containing protein [Fulvivirga lutea]
MRSVLFIIGFFFLLSEHTVAQQPVKLQGQEEINLNFHFYYFIDETGSLTKEEVELREFEPVPSTGLRTNASEQAIWLKLKVLNTHHENQSYYLQFVDPTIYKLLLHDEDQVFRSGIGFHPTERFINSHKHSFFLKQAPEVEKEYLIKATAAIKITLDAKLIKHDVYTERISKERFFLGLFYGGMIILFIYSVLLLITTGQRMFAYYAGYIFFVALLTGAGDGITGEFLHAWVRWKEGYQDAASAVASNVLGVMFMIMFLDVKKWSSVFYKLNVGFMFLVGISGIILLQLEHDIIFDLLGLYGIIQVLLMVSTSIQAKRKNVPQAGYFLVAYILFGFFIVWFILSLFRILPYGFISQYAIHLGYGISVIVLSYGVGVRINSYYKKLLKKEQEEQELIKRKNEELEQQVAIRTEFLAEKEGNLRSIIDNNTNAIWLVNNKYELIDYNNIFAKGWEAAYDQKLELGKSIIDQMPVQNLKVQWKVRYDTTMEGKPGTYYDQYIIGNKTRHYEIKTFPIFQDDEVRGVSLFSADITERIEWQNKLENQNLMLKKVNQELDSFVYSASHDLKAPLASVLGLINISRLEQNPKEKEKYYTMMETSIKRLDQFIKDIIDYSRNARTENVREKVDLKSVMANVFEDLRYIYEKEKVDVQLNIDQKAELYSDPMRLKVIVRNILSNALKYGCIKPKKNIIEIDASISKKKVNISIKDYGPGIDKVHHDQLFDMFYRASESTSGTGLGLYIVKETVTKLGGRVSVSSEPKKGTTFSLFLPNEINNES